MLSIASTSVRYWPQGDGRLAWAIISAPGPKRSFVVFTNACKNLEMSNFLQVIFPYKYEGVWVFDDESKGLDKEPFVFGADDIIDMMVADLDDAHDGFKLLFSHGPFPGYQAHGEWVREEMEGNWYRLSDHSIEGWLCPALLKYFDKPPQDIYAKAEPRDR